MALSARKIQAITKPGWYHDQGQRGLYLQVSPSGTKSWAFRYSIHGRPRWMGLGSLEDVSLAEARERAAAQRKVLLDGLDPIDARNAEQNAARLAEAKRTTFLQCAEDLLASKRGEWSCTKHMKQWEMTLRVYAKPLHAFDPVNIDLAMVTKVLTPIWTKTPATGSRLRARIEATLDRWAATNEVHGYSNPASWERLRHVLPSPAKLKQNGNGGDTPHHAALPFAEIPQFMTELRQKRALSAAALEMTILCATRTSETIGAAWAEFNIPAKVWTIPASRMKAGKEHRIPLPPRVIEILQGLDRRRSMPFGLSDRAMDLMLKSLRADITVHGMRSSFRDWAAETTNFPNHVVEMALAHTIGSKVEASYRRGDLFQKRTKLMEAWAAYCARPTIAGDNVVAPRG